MNNIMHETTIDRTTSALHHHIPCLDHQHMATCIKEPVVRWGTQQHRTYAGTYTFYDSAKLNALMSKPGLIQHSNCAMAIEPSDAMHFTDENAALQHIRAKRSISQLWQSMGIDIIIDLNIHNEYQHFNLCNVPKNTTVFASKMHGHDIDSVDIQYYTARRYVDADEITFAVYGTQPYLEALCIDRGWLWLPA